MLIAHSRRSHQLWLKSMYEGKVTGFGKKSGLLFVVALRVAKEAREQKQKSPHQRAFMSLRSRGSFAYPFLSPHRLVGVLLRLLTSCFC